MASTEEHEVLVQELSRRLEEAEETLRAIRSGEVDALVVDGPDGGKIYTLQGADHPYRVMIEAMQQGAASLSTDGTVLFCNRSFSELLGSAHEKVIGAAISGFFQDGQRTALQAGLIEAQSSSSQLEFTLRTGIGALRPVHIALNPLVLMDMTVICMVVTDLTEQKKHQDLQDADRRKDVFLATLSHEMRTPLNAIAGWVSILRREGCNPEDLREGLEVIERNAKAQAQLIDDVLDVSRIITGQLRLEVRECDLGAIVRETLNVIRPAAKAKGLGIEATLEPLAGPVSCDPARMQQVFWNLLSNAVKFTPRDGHIRIALSQVRDGARIEVKDTGSGIIAAFLPHVFDRFRQADSTTRRKFGGLGLGLSIVKQLVEMHGGTVEAHSDGEGRGSTFAIELPMLAPEVVALVTARQRAGRVPGAASVSPSENIRLDGVRIVLVDDEADARRLMTKLLGDAGADVIVASTVAEALQAVERFQPHVLVSDIAMPDEDGHDLIRQVRSRGHSAQSLPAVALTAFAGKGYAETALLAGFQVHVAKPVNPHELISVVKGLAQQAR